MGKIKGFYQNNRIYCFLMGISIVCLLLIALAFFVYFINQTKNDSYGNRLNGIENVQISKEHKAELIKYFTDQENVEKATINVKGKIIYTNVYLKDGNIETAQSLAIKFLDLLTEDEKNFYDINFTIIKNSGENDEKSFSIMGYKKSDKTIISWTKVNGEKWKKEEN